MKRLRNLIVCGLALACAATVFAGKPIDLRLKDGSRWRGEVSDRVVLKFVQQGIEIELTGRIVDAAELYLTVEGDIAGEIRRKTIFRDDIRAIRTLHGEDAVETLPARGSKQDRATEAAAADQPGVFVLPLSKMVGEYFRHEQMEQIAEEADKYGPGQIIVLLIDSGGGFVTEMEKIHEVLTEIKKRHRLVGWVEKAISAACATVLHCDEIYFMTEGTAGAMTAYGGTKAFEGEQLRDWLRRAGDIAEQGGRSRYIAEAMIHAPLMCSYDKDPETGEVRFYNDMSGEHVLSPAGKNLVFTSSTAVHSGFADGIADTEDELAKLLDLPKWHEISTYGRNISKEWHDTVDRGKYEITQLRARMSYAGTGSGDPVEILGKQIQIFQEMLRWYDRLDPLQPGIHFQGLPREDIEREIKELRKQLADLKKQQRRR